MDLKLGWSDLLCGHHDPEDRWLPNLYMFKPLKIYSLYVCHLFATVGINLSKIREYLSFANLQLIELYSVDLYLIALIDRRYLDNLLMCDEYR